MTQTLATIQPTETVAFDHAALAAFCAAEGDSAEETITRHLTDVEALIALIATQADHPAGLERSCTDLRRICATIGMTTVGDAAQAVLTCLSTGNAHALAACRARIVRLGEPKQTGGWAVEQAPGTVA